MEENRANSNLSPSWRELFAIQRKPLRYSSSASNICCRATRRSGPGPSLGRRSESRVVIPANLQSSFKWVTRRDSWDANCTPQSLLRGRQIRRTRIWKARPRTSVQKFTALQFVASFAQSVASDHMWHRIRIPTSTHVTTCCGLLAGSERARSF